MNPIIENLESHVHLNDHGTGSPIASQTKISRAFVQAVEDYADACCELGYSQIYVHQLPGAEESGPWTLGQMECPGMRRAYSNFRHLTNHDFARRIEHALLEVGFDTRNFEHVEKGRYAMSVEITDCDNLAMETTADAVVEELWSKIASRLDAHEQCCAIDIEAPQVPGGNLMASKILSENYSDQLHLGDIRLYADRSEMQKLIEIKLYKKAYTELEHSNDFAWRIKDGKFEVRYYSGTVGRIEHRRMTKKGWNMNDIPLFRIFAKNEKEHDHPHSEGMGE